MRFDKRNSIAYRMALVAAGAFDAAMALSPKWDWDVCAGALIAEEAGAKCTDHLGRPYLFNKPDPRQAALVCAAPLLHPLILKRCAPIHLPDLL
jgi:myo-inositol-1(or 4)-monophosphatase